MVVMAVVAVRAARAVLVIVVVIVRMRVPVVFAEHLLRERVILGERRIVAMLVAAAVGADFRLERRQRFVDLRAEPAQHVREHRIGFELQVAVADLDRRGPVAEVIRGAHQRERIVRTPEQHRFGRRDDAHQRAVVGDQPVAVAQHGAARQQDGDVLAGIERGRDAALAAGVIGGREGRRTRDERRGELHVGGDAFVERAHETKTGNQNRK
ncbi:hypothetical protein BvRS1_31380 [Burkholderia vietnamiensis]|nr:hypothetical protein BvRS1_31380 [Burkholderia vietnamiensis]